MKKRINIMTSCDDKLVKYIFPQLVSIDKNLREYDVHFYLAHSRIFPKDIQALKSFTREKTNISFHEARVTKDISVYESLVANGGYWPREAYFPLRVQDYIPDDVDRIMYIDAGDVIINGDIAPYYFDDFEEKSIIATLLGYKINPATKTVEMYTKDDFLTVSNGRLFNSGSYVINVDKFRKAGYTIKDYIKLRGLLLKNAKPGEWAYMGDQGFLAAAFVGDIKFFGYPQYKDHPLYTPYNFTMNYWSLFGKDPDYEIVVLHYGCPAKPWVVRFSEKDIKNVIDKPDFPGNHVNSPISELSGLSPKYLRHCEIWWDYAKETPMYGEANTRATITAETWVKHYLPICAKYIDVCNQIEQLEKGQA